MNRRYTLSDAVYALRAGEVIAYPTESVWGLGCDPSNPDAVEKILSLKNRPMDKGLILVAGTSQQVAFLLDSLPQARQAAIKATWPGPHTWLLPHQDRIPKWVTGQHASVAVRVSAYKPVAALCDAFGGPIISTSANPATMRAATEAFQVEKYFRGQVGVLQGRVQGLQKPSSITDALSLQRIR